MNESPLNEHLAQWAEHIEALQWSALLVDSDWRLVWVSSELMGFIGAENSVELGVGEHIVDAFLSDTWLRTVAPDSQHTLMADLGRFFLTELRKRQEDPSVFLPEPLPSLLEDLEPRDPPSVISTSFTYVNPDDDGELPAYKVNVFGQRLRDERGSVLGALMLFFMGVRPNLLALLARGDERMYERMARLVDPSPKQSAIVFCDLHQSGSLARTLSTAAYFKLVRRLWTGIDAVVAQEKGIVGKHAGDGASAYFLVDDLGSPSASAGAAIRTARRIHEISSGVFGEVIEDGCRMKVGLHWGGSLYMGQLVPGGRLDVTALGDEVNEAARIQECAQPHESLASKQLLERLVVEDAAALGLDLEKLLYQPLSELSTATAKATRDAGGIPVTSI